jgi:hypothetical protein
VLRVELGNDNLVAMLCTSRAYASQPCWLALAHVRVGPVPVLEARSSPPYTFRVPHPAPHRTASSRMLLDQDSLTAILTKQGHNDKETGHRHEDRHGRNRVEPGAPPHRAFAFSRTGSTRAASPHRCCLVPACSFRFERSPSRARHHVSTYLFT